MIREVILPFGGSLDVLCCRQCDKMVALSVVPEMIKGLPLTGGPAVIPPGWVCFVASGEPRKDFCPSCAADAVANTYLPASQKPA